MQIQQLLCLQNSTLNVFYFFCFHGWSKRARFLHLLRRDMKDIPTSPICHSKEGRCYEQTKIQTNNRPMAVCQFQSSRKTLYSGRELPGSVSPVSESWYRCQVPLFLYGHGKRRKTRVHFPAVCRKKVRDQTYQPVASYCRAGGRKVHQSLFWKTNTRT